MTRRYILDAAAFDRFLEAVQAHVQASRRDDPELRAAFAGLVTTSRQAPDPRTYLTTVEAAHRLGISERTVRRRIADGTIPVVRLGRLVRIPATATNGQERPPAATTGDDAPPPPHAHDG